MMTSAGELRRVEDEFVALEQNWAPGSCLTAREDRGESRGVAGWTKWSPESRRRPWPRRQTVHGGHSHGGEDAGGEEEEGDVPETQQLTLDGWGSSAWSEGARGGRNSPGRRRPRWTMARMRASATGLPGSIPPVGRESRSQRSRWRRQPELGWPESTGMCGGRHGGMSQLGLGLPREKREREQGEKEGSRGVVGCSLSTLGGRRRGEQGWPRRHGHGMAPVSMVGPVGGEKKPFAKKKPSLISNNYKEVQRPV